MDTTASEPARDEWRWLRPDRPWRLIVAVAVPFWVYLAVARIASVQAWVTAGAIQTAAPWSARLLQFMLLLPMVLLGFRYQLHVASRGRSAIYSVLLAVAAAILCVLLARPALLVAMKWTHGIGALEQDFAYLLMSPLDALSLWMLGYLEFAFNYWFGLALVLVAHNWQRLRLETERRARVELAWRETRLETLKSKLRPHFLFNTLNTIATVAEEHPGRARRLIVTLSDLLRRSVDDEDQGQVTLAHEIQTMRCYLTLQEERFGSRLKVTIDVPEKLQFLPVPSFLLQPLIENAVQHGLAGRSAVVDIHITGVLDQGADRALVLRIGNSWLPGSSPAGPSTGLGLRLTKERLQALYGDVAALTIHADLPNQFIAEVRMPVPAPSPLTRVG